MCTLFFSVILFMYKAELSASDMQFGFKEARYTTLCNFVFKEIISNSPK